MQEDMKKYKILCMHHELNLEFFVSEKVGRSRKSGGVGTERTSS